MSQFNETYRVLQPMKYATAKKKEVLDAALADPNYGIQLKMDGCSYVLAVDLDHSVHLYGDRISKKNGEVIDKIDNLQHVKEWARETLPSGTQLCVEVCFGDTSKDVNTIMLALPEKANARQAEKKARIYIFDILFWDKKEIHLWDFANRWAAMEKIWAGFLETPDWLSIAELITENKKEVLAGWLAAGHEGGVLKMLNSTKKTSAKHHVRELGETPARPMNTTFKIKQVDTVDCVIMGIEMPTSEYTGKDPENHAYKDEDGNAINRLYALGYANAFTIGAYDNDGNLIKIGTVASGLDDIMRLAAAENPEEFIGQTVEIVCMSIDKVAHTLRHPRLVRVRFDKQAELCNYQEIFAQ